MASRWSSQRQLWVVAGAAWLAFGALLVAKLTAEPPTRPTPTLGVTARAETPEETARRLFEEAAAWVARGKPVDRGVKVIYLALDAKFDLDAVHSEGPLRLWLQMPDLYRQEMTLSNSTQIKILKQGRLWIRGASGEFREMDRTPDGDAALEQAKGDLGRLVDMTDFLTLRSLTGPGVTFESEGKKKPSGIFARPGGGTWWKIVRKAAGRPDISFWLAHSSDKAGVVHATFPGVVRMAGEPQNDIATEDYILRDWEDQPTDPKRAFRFPHTIRALQSRPGQPPTEFLRAAVTDVRLDAGVEPAVFSPTSAWISPSRR